jgi:hypothetical protein
MHAKSNFSAIRDRWLPNKRINKFILWPRSNLPQTVKKQLKVYVLVKSALYNYVNLIALFSLYNFMLKCQEKYQIGHNV